MSPGPTKPILALRRAETHELCTLLDLTVADDPTNTDRRFRRTRMRHDVIPLLNDVADRDVTALLTRSSTLLREDEVLLDQLAAELDPTDARGLAAAPLPLARRSVRQWILSTTVNDDDPLNRHPPDAATGERVLAFEELSEHENEWVVGLAGHSEPCAVSHLVLATIDQFER